MRKCYMMIWMAMGLGFLSCTGNAVDNKTTAAMACCIEKIDVFHDAVVSNATALFSQSFEIANMIQASSTNQAERVWLLRRFNAAFFSINLLLLPEESRGGVVGNYWNAAAVIGGAMLANGADEKEVGDNLIAAMTKYKEMCFSFGDENDHSDGEGRVARRRRDNARGLRGAWENDVTFFEWTMIDAVFGSISKEASKRFLDRWHREFGCHLKSHPEYKALNPEK